MTDQATPLASYTSLPRTFHEPSTHPHARYRSNFTSRAYTSSHRVVSIPRAGSRPPVVCVTGDSMGDEVITLPFPVPFHHLPLAYYRHPPPSTALTSTTLFQVYRSLSQLMAPLGPEHAPVLMTRAAGISLQLPTSSHHPIAHHRPPSCSPPSS